MSLMSNLLSFFFQVAEDVSEQNLSEWVNSERFEGFIHVTRSNFHDITETSKSLVIKC